MPVLHHEGVSVDGSGKLESQLAGLVADGPIPLMVQRDGIIAYSNAAARRDFGDNAGIGRPAYVSIERLHPDDRARFAEARTSCAPDGLTHQIVRLEVEPEVYRKTLLTIFTVEFDGPAVAYLTRDLSAELEAQAELVVSGRAASAATLAAGVAHEINNPLATVMTNIGFIFDQLRLIAAALAIPSTEVASRMRESLDALEDTHASGMRIEAIVRDLRTFAPSEEERTIVDVNEVVQIALRLSRAEIEARARVVCNFGDPPFVDANAGRLARAVSSMMANAADAIAEGEGDQNEVRISTRADGEMAVIEIADSGHGIPPDVRSRIFDPFFSTKPQGAGVGLGLFVVQAVVASLGGRIEVDTTLAAPEGVTSIRDHGTTMRVFLPGIPEAPQSHEHVRNEV